ncbi:MAG TPA: PAS domain-containing sensor histidine kinase [Hyphomicrobiaceae bacterium]|nr:PAS domain-containing sensor histidine kinase [Hyphomicrobiaceae bacterium]
MRTKETIKAAIAAAEAWVHSRVHPSVVKDKFEGARHAALIGSHILGGLLAGIVFATFLSWTGAFGIAAILAALWFLSPFLIAGYLSRTGKLDAAHLLSAVNLTGIVVIAAVLSGGGTSFALVWLAIVPLEAALSANRRMMIAATALAVTALIGLHAATVMDLLPAMTALAVPADKLALVSHLAAIAYAGGLASSVQQMHRDSQKEIEAGRARFRLIAENANDLVTQHDATGRMTFASLASRRLLGLEPDRLIAAGMESQLSVDDRVRYSRAIAQCLATGAPVAEEFRLHRIASDASLAVEQRFVEMRCQPVFGAESIDGRPMAVIAVTRDISERKANEQALAKARDEAEKASVAKTSFLAAMSHELRTPLSSIIGFAELLHRELLIRSREPKHADYCRIIHESGEHLLSLVKDLLDVAKIESGKYTIIVEPVSIAEIVRSAVETMKPAADQAEVTIVRSVATDLPDALADRRAVKQILLNLISNACKFTNSGGEISVKAEQRGERIALIVADTGIGIGPEHIARIGQPFYQIDTPLARRVDGAGLGLSIVRGLVELHGGEMTVSSKVGEGTEFTILFKAELGDEDEAGIAAPRALRDAPAVTTTAPSAAASVHLELQLDSAPETR